MVPSLKGTVNVRQKDVQGMTFLPWLALRGELAVSFRECKVLRHIFKMPTTTLPGCNGGK